MDKIKHIFCESTNISNVPIVDGQIIAFTDQIGWAYDVSSTRYTVSGGAIINDSTVSVNQTWSSSKSRTEIDAVRGGSAFCPTASSVAAKEAICVGYTATADTYLPIVLVNANGANSALTLSVNGETARPIYIDGAPSSSDNKVLPAGSYIIYYDGTNYYFRTDGKLTGAGLVDVDGNTDKFLRGDGTWQPVGSTYDDSDLVNNTPWYGTSSTGATTQAKVATTNAQKLGTLEAGQKAKIKFTYTNTHATPTLNVDGKGAKSIKAYGSTAPNMWWKAGDVVEFTYDGTNWVMGPTSGQISDLKSGIGFVGTTAEITAAINNGTITEGMLVYNTEESSEPATRGNAPFVSCSTARNIVAKVVTVDQFNLTKGALVTVKFTDATATDPSSGDLTLNVSGTGAKPIADEHSNALTYESASYFCNNRVCEFQYDGTNWVWLNSDLELHVTVTQLNNDLSNFMFRNNNGIPELSIDNGTTWQKIGGGGMPILDYTNPLHTFTSTNKTYTATKECYLMGTFCADTVSSYLTINGKILAYRSSNNDLYNGVFIPCTRLSADDVVVANVVSAFDTSPRLFVFDVES